MTYNKHVSLEEARKSGKLDRFVKEHPSESDRERFNGLLKAMSRGALKGEETLKPDRAACSTGTQTRRGI